MKKIRIGLIGAGMIAESAHVPALIGNDEVDFTVIVESNFNRAKSLNSKFGIDIPVISELGELKSKIDAAIICTPNDSHKKLCLKCFELGIHVLVEKPLANTYQESIDIFEAAQAGNFVLMVGYCTRFWPSVQYVKDIIDHNVFGNIKRFVFQYGSEGGWSPYSNYILSKQKSGGGAFVINASHYLDRMLWFFGDPDESTFFDDADGGIEANAVAEFRYSKNVQFKGIIRVSKTVNLDSGCFMEFEKGIIVLRDWMDPLLSIQFLEIDSKTQFIPNSRDFSLRTRPSMFTLQLKEFVSKIKGNNCKALSSLEDAINNVKIIEELYGKKEVLHCDWYKK